MPFSREEYELNRKRFLEVNGDIGHPVNGFNEERMEILKKLLISLRHHDEYYTIMDLRTMNLNWCFGVENALGYDSGAWPHYEVIKGVHDDFRKLYLIFGSLAYQVLQVRRNLPQTPLMGRYIINIPVLKKNGRYVWVKQMSMPLNTDEKGRMVQQMNVYTVIGRYDDIFLPIAPRIFLDKTKRAKHIEKEMFEDFMKITGINFKTQHVQLLRKYLQLGKEPDIDPETGRAKPLTHARIASDLKKAPTTVIKEAAQVHKIVKDALGVNFPSIYQIARFFKPLYGGQEPQQG